MNQNCQSKQFLINIKKNKQYPKFGSTEDWKKFCLKLKKTQNNFKDLMNKNIKIDYNKFDNAIKTTSFENLQKLEKENGYIESIKYNQKDNITFFKKGIQRDWKEILPEKLMKELEMNFLKEMKEIGYL